MHKVRPKMTMARTIQRVLVVSLAATWDIVDGRCVQGTSGEWTWPYCDRRAEPPVKGHLERYEVEGHELWDLALEADCAYKLWTPPEVAQCLQGHWVVLSGASQTAVWTSQMVNSLVPGALITKADNFSIDGVFTQLLDVIIQDGKVIYKNVLMDPRYDGNPDHNRFDVHTPERDNTVLRVAFQGVNKAPAFQPGMIRITNFMAEYWDSVGMALEAVQGASNWAGAEVTLAVTVGLWYINNWWCNPNQKENNWCGTRPAYASEDYEVIVKQFRADQEQAMPQLQKFCSASGRAGKKGCSLLSIDHCQNMKEKDPIWVSTFEATRDVMQPLKTPLFRFVDLWTLTQQIPEDCLGGHQSPMSAVWTWQVLLSGICDIPQPTQGTMAVFQGPTCRSSAVSNQCPDNGHTKGFHFEWECGLATPCTLVAGPPPPGVGPAKPCPITTHTTTTMTTSTTTIGPSSNIFMGVAIGGASCCLCAGAFAALAMFAKGKSTANSESAAELMTGSADPLD